MAGWNAGKMRHRAEVWEPAGTLDSHGQESGEDRLVFGSLPCEIESLNGREQALAEQLQVQRAVMIRAPGLPQGQIAERYFLKVGSRRFDVAFVKDLNQDGRKLELLCGERA